jgi:hypothetical protein
LLNDLHGLIDSREALVPEDRVYAVLSMLNLQIDISYDERDEASYRSRRELLRKRNCDGSWLITAQQLKKSRDRLLEQLGQAPATENAFKDFKLHSMLDASLNNKPEWKDIANLVLDMAKHPHLVVDTQYCLSTIYRQVQDFCVLWIQVTQVVAGITFPCVYQGHAYTYVRDYD